MLNDLRLLSVEQTAEALGLCRQTIYAWVKQRRIPYIKLGQRKIAFDSSDLGDFVNRLKVSPVER